MKARARSVQFQVALTNTRISAMDTKIAERFDDF